MKRRPIIEGSDHHSLIPDNAEIAQGSQIYFFPQNLPLILL